MCDCHAPVSDTHSRLATPGTIRKSSIPPSFPRSALDADGPPEHVYSRDELFAYLVRHFGHMAGQHTATDGLGGAGAGANSSGSGGDADAPGAAAQASLTRRSLAVGMVGYPNVGKSTVINALLQRKRVATGPTPGKTKHLQTHFIEVPRHGGGASAEPVEEAETTEAKAKAEMAGFPIMLVDCPGLVFPSWRLSVEEMLCDGILPIDQMRDHTGVRTAPRPPGEGEGRGAGRGAGQRRGTAWEVGESNRKLVRKKGADGF